MAARALPGGAVRGRAISSSVPACLANLLTGVDVQVEAHFDTDPYWVPRVRVHIPVRTNEHVLFKCGQRGDEVRSPLARTCKRAHAREVC